MTSESAEDEIRRAIDYLEAAAKLGVRNIAAVDKGGNWTGDLQVLGVEQLSVNGQAHFKKLQEDVAAQISEKALVDAILRTGITEVQDWQATFHDVLKEPVNNISKLLKLTFESEMLIAHDLHKMKASFAAHDASHRSKQDSDYRKFVQRIEKNFTRISKKTASSEHHVEKLATQLASAIAVQSKNMSGENRQSFGLPSLETKDEDVIHAYVMVTQFFRVAQLLAGILPALTQSSDKEVLFEVKSAMRWLATKALPNLFSKFSKRPFKVSQKDGEVVCDAPVEFAVLAAEAIGINLTPANLLKLRIRANPNSKPRKPRAKGH